MKMGAYHFARPDLNPTNAGAVAEANYFLSVAQPYIISCELPPSLDLEGSYLTTNFTSAQLTAWVQNWMNTVQSATGIKPVLYIGASTVSYLNSSLNTYPLWRDEVSGSPSPPTNLGVWTTWAFNQYSWTGTVPGIAGSGTDLNVFNGNMTAFNNFMGCTTDIKQSNLNNSFVIYPNPASNNFQIDYPTINGEVVVNIYDINGKIVLSQDLTPTLSTREGGTATIDVSKLNEGVYNLSIAGNHNIINKRLVIVR
jgi:hypothetical protein